MNRLCPFKCLKLRFPFTVLLHFSILNFVDRCFCFWLLCLDFTLNHHSVVMKQWIEPKKNCAPLSFLTFSTLFEIRLQPPSTHVHTFCPLFLREISISSCKPFLCDKNEISLFIFIFLSALRIFFLFSHFFAFIHFSTFVSNRFDSIHFLLAVHPVGEWGNR